MRSKDEQEFVDYLKKRWDDLRKTTDYVNRKVQDDEMTCCELLTDAKITAADANRADYHVETCSQEDLPLRHAHCVLHLPRRNVRGIRAACFPK